jgi:hypothetical protein
MIPYARTARTGSFVEMESGVGVAEGCLMGTLAGDWLKNPGGSFLGVVKIF